MSQWVKSPRRNSVGQFLRSRAVLVWNASTSGPYRRYKDRRAQRAKK